MDGVFADAKECLERQTVTTQVNFHHSRGSLHGDDANMQPVEGNLELRSC
jgi:hypothetical protein